MLYLLMLFDFLLLLISLSLSIYISLYIYIYHFESFRGCIWIQSLVCKLVLCHIVGDFKLVVMMKEREPSNEN